MIEQFLQFSLFSVLSIGGIVLAYLAKYSGFGMLLPKTLQNAVTGVFLAVSVYSFGYLHGANRDADKLRTANDKIEFLNNQNEENAKIAKEQQLLAQSRQDKIIELEKESKGYLDDLKNNKTNAAPSDDAYTDRLQRIIEQSRTSGTTNSQ